MTSLHADTLMQWASPWPVRLKLIKAGVTSSWRQASQIMGYAGLLGMWRAITSPRLIPCETR
jgi:hypothetical protein